MRGKDQQIARTRVYKMKFANTDNGSEIVVTNLKLQKSVALLISLSTTQIRTILTSLLTRLPY